MAEGVSLTAEPDRLIDRVRPGGGQPGGRRREAATDIRTGLRRLLEVAP